MPRAPRDILVVTGSRAEFGLLLPVLRAIQSSPPLRLRLVVAGAHLTQGTWRDAAREGFTIDARVRMQRRREVSRAAYALAVGRGIAGFVRVFERLKPDVVLVLGDRVEAFAAACAAGVGGWRLAHVHGGDRAEGVADEAMRHATSKLAHLHFPATATSCRRLLRMGEDPRWLFNVGSPAIDGLAGVAPADPARLARLGIDATAPYLVVAQHPVGADESRERVWMRGTLRGTARRGREPWQRVAIAPNTDPGREGIMTALREAGIEPVGHLPRPEFLRILRGAAALVGNSSAGLIEASALGPGGVPVVNVGPRQAGRERAGRVVDAAYGESAVRGALRRALASPPRPRHPYGDGRTGSRIATILGRLDLTSVPIRKQNCY